MSAETWSSLFDTPYLREWEARQREPVEAVPTGLPSLDRVCGDDGGRIGPALGWFVTIGGNPGHGKSLFALNLTWAALRAGQPVAFVTLEMTHWALATRLYSIATGHPIHRLERGVDFQPGGLAHELRELWAENRCADLHVNREPLNSIAEVQEHLEGCTLAGVRVVFVDYLQLIGTGTDEDVYRQTVEVATTLRRFAHVNRVLVVGLSQYNRATSANYTQSPIAQSLHGGMSLEANSDLVLLLDHSRYERDPLKPHLARTWAIVGKNRHGPVTHVPLEWDYRTLRVREADPDEEGQWPGARRKAA